MGIGQERSAGIRNGRAPALLPHAPHPELLGPAVMLVWTQCMLYARYLWVDAGVTTVAINYARCAFIAVLALIALSGRFTSRFQDVLGRVSVVLMTLGSLVFYLMGYFDEPPWMMLLAAVLAGVGVTWGEGMWIKAYMRLSAREVLFYSLASLASFSCAGLFIGFIPEYITFLIGMLLPMVAYLMYQRSMRFLDEREGDCAPEVPRALDNVYADEPRSSYRRILVGIALFSFVMGVSRGFPYGSSIRIGQGFQMLQHLALIAVACILCYRTLAKGRRLRFVWLWEIQLAAMALGVLLLSTYDDAATAAGATIMAVANLCQVIYLWLTAIDYARHRTGSAFHALAAVWLCHLLFRETGRLAIIGLTAWGAVDSSVVLALLIGLLVICMALVLTGPVPRVRPLFVEFHEAGGESHDAPGCDEAADDGRSPTEGASAAPAPRPSAEVLARRWGLTPREADVALLLAEGRTMSYAAGELGLAENTVRGYTKQVYEKAGVHSKQELIDLVRSL